MTLASRVPALSLVEVRKSFGSSEIINGVSLAVASGERVGLIGPNGAGKSTLFDMISGRLQPSSGYILLNGHPIRGMKPYQVNRLGLSRSFQISHIFPKLSVFDNLRCGVLWSMGYRYTVFKFLQDLSDANARTEEIMSQVRLHPKRTTLAMHLGYAEQRALELGITLASGASMILLDEPTAGMSQLEAAYFVALIQAATEGKSLLIIEHDMHVLFGLADKIAVLVHGSLLAFDRPEAVRANALVQEAYLGVTTLET